MSKISIFVFNLGIFYLILAIFMLTWAFYHIILSIFGLNFIFSVRIWIFLAISVQILCIKWRMVNQVTRKPGYHWWPGSQGCNSDHCKLSQIQKQIRQSQIITKLVIHTLLLRWFYDVSKMIFVILVLLFLLFWNQVICLSTNGHPKTCWN